jgi:GxxExxY protein
MRFRFPLRRVRPVGRFRRRRGRGFGRRFGALGARRGGILLETAMFVLAAGAAVTRIVAARSVHDWSVTEGTEATGTEETEGTGTEEAEGTESTKRNGETEGRQLETHRLGHKCRRPNNCSMLCMPVDTAAFNDLTGQILAAAIEVHRTLGPGLLESIYSKCLAVELASRGVRFTVARPVPITYKGTRLDLTYRIDLVVEDRVVVEVKAVAAILPVFQAQALTYMRLIECPAGLIINFNAPRLMDGVKRLINARAVADQSLP